MLKWMRHYYLKMPVKPVECVQRAGEVMYVPSLWRHAIINLQSSIGITYEVGEEGEDLEHEDETTETCKGTGIYVCDENHEQHWQQMHLQQSDKQAHEAVAKKAHGLFGGKLRRASTKLRRERRRRQRGKG